jgi:CRP-like cAMP-binding protein
MSKNLSPPPFVPKAITHPIAPNAPKLSLIDAQETAVEKLSFIPQAPALPAIGIFDDLPGYILDELLPIGKRLRFDAHENINDVGDQCMGLGMIIEGAVRVDRMDALGWDSITTLKAGDLIGAMEWLDSKEWEERMVATSRTEILMLPSEKLKALSTKYPELQRSLERHTERHLLLTLLGAHELFQQLEDTMLLELIEDSYLRTVANQAKLFDQTTSIAAIFMIAKGEILLSKNQRLIHTLMVGELANVEIVLGDGMTELTGTAKGTTSLFVLPLERVEMVLSRAGLMPALKKIAHQQRARSIR